MGESSLGILEEQIEFFIRHFLLKLHFYVTEYIIKNFQTNSLTYYTLFNIDYCLRKYEVLPV